MGSKLKRVLNGRKLLSRIEELEAEVQECRQVNVRLAELCDVMMELVVPLNQRDEKAVEEIVARYRAGLGTQ